MRPMTDGSGYARATMVGDLVGLTAFLVVGLDRHGEDVAARFLALAAIFLAAWLLTAWSLGAYRPPTHARLLLTLALGIPLSVLVRATFVQAWTAREILTFAGVAVVFGALFVGTARVVTSLWFGRKARS
jgi:Protein of unknown function (DUF3054)